MAYSDDRSDDQERRNYFRIDDDVHLRVRPIEEEEYRSRLNDPDGFEPEPCSMVAQLRALTSQAGMLLAGIRKTDPEIAQYLSIIDRKIDLLAGLVEGERHGEQAPNARINVGAGGFSFRSAEPLAKGTKLEIRLLFFPSYLCIHAYGRVVRSEEAGGDRTEPYSIGVEFTLIPENEREALVKHTLERQSAMLRERSGR